MSQAHQAAIETIGSEERGLAACTHLSGLAGYIVPGAGLIVPIIIWIVKKDHPVISAIAKQALLLNLAVFIVGFCLGGLLLTIVLIPLAFLGWFLLGLIALTLPIVGAVKANDGVFYRYPVIGSLL